MVVGGKLSGVEVPIGNESVTIGSARDNLLCLQGEGIDKYHALLLCLPTGFALQDNHTGGITLVNGQKIDRYVLVDGDIITVGDNEIRFLIGTDASAAVEAAQLHVSMSGDMGRVRAMLYFVSGPHERLEVPLSDGAITLGRRSDCAVVLSDPHASGQHCQIAWVGNGYQITEIKATYGTYVNGQKISTPTMLAPGDTIGVGSSVIEFRPLGGVSQEHGSTTVIADGAYAIQSKPKFVIGGHVIARDKITIGRAAGSDIFLEEDEISRTHCEIRWDGNGFVIADKSKAGTYIGSRRIVEERLQSGHVVRVGPHVYNIDVRGERCSLEHIDAEAAMAAIEVARETQFNLKGAQPSQNDAGYKTLTRIIVL
jgi:pSer/pThr/pTyr-binding forkhead associated (FHA) protein